MKIYLCVSFVVLKCIGLEIVHMLIRKWGWWLTGKGAHMSTTYTCSDRQKILLGETLGCALIDTDCTKTVCGEIWFESFLDSLSCEKVKKLILRSLILFINFIIIIIM